MTSNVAKLLAIVALSLLVFPLVSALHESDTVWEIKVNGDTVAFGNNVQNVVATDGSVVGEDIVDEEGRTTSALDNDAVVDNDDTLVRSVSVEEGQTVDVEVILKTGSVALKDVQVEARVKGYEYERYEALRDSTDLFDVSANSQKRANLQVDLPTRLEKKEYWLHVTIDTDNEQSVEQIVKLNIEPVRHGVDIEDVFFSPGNTVKAGRSLLATVVLENFGDKDQEDVKVTVSIPTLGVSATEFVDNLDTDNHNVNSEDVSEMFLPIPANAEAGTYDVVVTAEYDRFRETSQTFPIQVLANELYQQGDEETLVLAVGPETQTLAQGKTARYAVALTNGGTKSRAYLLSAAAGSWATVSLSESLVVLESGKNKVVYVDVTAAPDAVQGTQTVALSISANGDVLETVSLGATVVPGQPAQQLSLRNGLEIALIVLVVVLVIIGLIIGFSRMRKDEGEEKAYY